MKKIILILFIALTTVFAHAGLFDKNPRFLKVEDAFQFLAVQNEQQVNLHWQIADNYYLYKKEIHIQPENAQLSTYNFPTGEIHQDEFLGETEVYRHDLDIDLLLSQVVDNAKLIISYQGCTKGFCYPPVTKELVLNKFIDQAYNSGKKTTALSDSPKKDNLTQRLFESKYTVFWFFLLGIGLAFTPCVLPMLPLLSAIVIGANERASTPRALALSFTYVQGMALTYTLLGLIVAAIGLPFQVALQSPPVLITLSIIFVLLATSMFGVFTLQLPTSLQTKLTSFSHKQKSGAFLGVFVMGAVAGLVASPCTSAPLSGALLYVAQSGDLFTGAITLYLLALGMGIPLILITVFGNKVLPKSGDWMENVKIAFGFVMLSLPIFLISRLIPEMWESSLWALLGTSFCMWLALQIKKTGFALLVKIFLFIAAFILSKPLQDLFWENNHESTIKSAVQNTEVLSHQFTRVSTYKELQSALQNNPNSVAMLDFYADWCVACKEFEKYTFTDPKVKQAFNSILLLQIDMTKNTEANAELAEKLHIIGLPTIVFFDKNGQEVEGARISGFMQADEFMEWLKEEVKL